MTPTGHHLSRIVSGGQSGVDRAGLDAAVRVGLPYGGWCPAGGWAEDRPEPPGLLLDYPLLRETATSEPEHRTRLNVRDSDLVLILRPGGASSPGTDLTAHVASELGRPCLEVSSRAGDAEEVVAWLLTHRRGAVLDVAGPRESERRGAYAEALALLLRVLTALADTSATLPDG